MKKVKEWLKSGSNFIDILMLLGLIIIIATTMYLSRIAGFYLLGFILIIIPGIFYILTRK